MKKKMRCLKKEIANSRGTLYGELKSGVTRALWSIVRLDC